MAAPGALSVAHDPARTRAPAAAGDALARPVRVRLSARGARVARDGADVVRHGPTRNRTENLLIKSQLLCQLSYRPGAPPPLGAGPENSSGLAVEARERLGKPIFAPHSSVSLNVSLIGNRSTQSRRAKSLSDQMT